MTDRLFPTLFFAAVVFSAASLSANRPALADDYEDYITPAQAVEVFADSCIEHMNDSYHRFQAFANEKYFRMTGNQFRYEMAAYAYKKGELWAPTQKGTNVYLARDYDSNACKLSGVLSDPNQLRHEIMKLIENRPMLFRDFWNESEISVDMVKMDAPKGVNAIRYYISSPKSLSDHEVTLKTYSDDLNKNFELTVEKGLAENRIELKQMQQSEPR